MIDTEPQVVKWLKVQRRIALGDSRGIASAIWQRRCSGLVRLQRTVKRHVALPRQVILEECKLPGHFPLDAGNGHAGSTVKAGVFEVASLEIHEGPRNMLVWIIAP